MSTNSTKLAHATYKVRAEARSRVQQHPTQVPSVASDTPIFINPCLEVRIVCYE